MTAYECAIEVMKNARSMEIEILSMVQTEAERLTRYASDLDSGKYALRSYAAHVAAISTGVNILRMLVAYGGKVPALLSEEVEEGKENVPEQYLVVKYFKNGATDIFNADSKASAESFYEELISGEESREVSKVVVAKVHKLYVSGERCITWGIPTDVGNIEAARKNLSERQLRLVDRKECSHDRQDT